MRTSSAKAKGRKWQQRIARSLAEVFGWEEGDAESRSTGSPGVDIMLAAKARKDFPFSIEAKNTKAFSSWAGLEQAQANAIKNTIGALVWKRARKDQGMICFDFDEFIRFWKEKTSEE